MTQKQNTFILLAMLLMLTVNLRAQVGINKDKPDECSILHISDDKRGVILPSIASDASLSITNTEGPSYTPGLLYYNNTVNKFHYHNGTAWQVLNPWNSTSGSSEITTDKAVTVDNTLKATTVNATTISGFGTIPIGGIIMWSGTVVPNGWALCNGGTVNGYTTPNLTGRFIVGYSASDPSYDQPGNLSEKGSTGGETGGEAFHSLKRSEIPKHQHVIGNGTDGASFSEPPDPYATGVDHYDKPDINGAGSKKENPVTKVYLTYSNHTHSGVTGDGASGGLTADSFGNADGHENRPPYYVLAFIMRVE